MFYLWKIVVIFSLLYLFTDARRSSKNIKNDTEISDKAKLIFAHVIFRHGDRTPLATYPTDPWKDSWPEGFGQLTNLGIVQEYELGKYLNRRYKSLLGDGHYSKDIVYVQSTDVDRTLMSAEACMAGLFPSTGSQIWNKDLLWQPIPIHTVPKEMDYILAANKTCPLYERAKQKYLASPQFTAILAKYKDLFDHLQEMSGMPIQTFEDAELLYNTLWIENLKNKGLPVWADEVFMENSDFELAANQSFRIPTNTSLLARLSTGFLIREILEHFESKIDASLSPDRSIWIYSAHDSTLVNVLNSLGLFDGQSPPYAASLHFELYALNDEYYMQIVYRNTSDENPLPLEIPSCGTKCPLEKFMSIYSTIIPTGTFDEECQLPLHVRILEGNDLCVSHTWFIVMVCGVCVIPFLALITWKVLSRSRGNIIMENNNQKYI